MPAHAGESSSQLRRCRAGPCPPKGKPGGGVMSMRETPAENSAGCGISGTLKAGMRNLCSASRCQEKRGHEEAARRSRREMTFKLKPPGMDHRSAIVHMKGLHLVNSPYGFDDAGENPRKAGLRTRSAVNGRRAPATAGHTKPQGRDDGVTSAQMRARQYQYETKQQEIVSGLSTNYFRS